MIALTGDGWDTAKLAIGRFGKDGTAYWGVNADVIAGKLLVGENLVIENGAKSFKFDATGAWLKNSTLLFTHDDGCQLMLDPVHGLAAGSNIREVDDKGNVTFSFINPETGEIEWDTGPDGKTKLVPKGTNFYIDAKTGRAYFRGDIYAENGYFSGEINATSGVFKGTLEAAKLKGDLTVDPDAGEDGGWLVGCGIKVGKNDAGGYNFYVDSEGNVTINQGAISWGAVTGTEAIDQRIDDAQKTANSASSKARTAADNIKKLANGTYAGGTFIDGQHVMSPYIKGGRVAGTEIFGGIFGDYDGQTDIEKWEPNVWIRMGDDVGGGDGMYVWSQSYKTVPLLRLYNDKTGEIALQMRGMTLIRITASNEVQTPLFHYTLA